MDDLKNWTLFLDRDGVINKKAAEGYYITSVGEFIFLPKAIEAIKILSGLFGRIIILTNQQGIAKNMIDLDELSEIHSYLIRSVENSGGRIDGVWVCPHLAGTCECRKPKIGLALEAQKYFPDIDLKRSFVAGDSESDMDLAHNINAVPVAIIDGEYSLYDFAMVWRAEDLL